MEVVLENTTSQFLDTREPRCGRRIVKALDWFLFLGETVYDEIDLDPSSYNESIFYKNLRNGKNAIKVEIESLYTNHVWELVEPLVSRPETQPMWIEGTWLADSLAT